MRVRWMLFWLLFGLLLEFISHQCISVINTLADHHHRGTDFGGSPWLHVIIAFPTSYKVVITLWIVYLWVSLLKTIFWSRNGHDGSTDVQQRAWRSNRRRQEGNKIVLKDVITLRRHVETKVRAKIRKRKVTTKINHHDKINGKRKTARKQKMFQRAQELRRRAEDYHKCKIPPSARKALCNWVSLLVFLAFGHSLPGQDMDTFFSLQLCAQALQREMAERKAAYKHHSPIPVGNRVAQKHLHPHPVGPLI
ncbi:nuclear pore complex interacting protein family member B3 [Homo sapiens]|uniref:Nuclear pore complex interacting protein family member B4 n=1 Tax=Homo sapiens TaxID=9606 RepID=A0A087WT63_HUMAN|nr:nuclear pore complex interacting protein family member B4 [Homo sapiens]KAI4054036.1 nuclear pore complex interacting protein family member B4 [Homo sapiens]KAI4054057.1 nuclear pore complex interacting protein family member B3 [Homo sapiens]